MTAVSEVSCTSLRAEIAPAVRLSFAARKIRKETKRVVSDGHLLNTLLSNLCHLVIDTLE